MSGMIDADETRTYIENLMDGRKSVRENARKALRHFGKDAYPFLLQQFEKDCQHQSSQNEFIEQVGQIITVAAGCCMALGLIGFRFFNSILLYGGVFCFATLLFICGLLLSELAKRTPKHTSAAYPLLYSRIDPTIIAVILEHYTAEQIWLNADILALLEKQISHLERAGWETLTPPQRESLLRIVEQQGITDRKESQKFALRGLTALKSLADSEAVPTVKHLAKYGTSKEVRAAAQRYLGSSEQIMMENT